MKTVNTSKKISVVALMAILASVGYGGYTIIKEKDLAKLRSGESVRYEVARVIDGDTFELADGDIVRLLGIDAPEEGECFGGESKTALKKLIEGKEVELRTDVTGVDDFGRLLRYAVLPAVSPLGSGTLVDEYMVERGFGDVNQYPRDRLYFNLLVEKREQAMRESKGLWAVCEQIPSEYSQANTEPTNKQCTIKGNISTGAFGKTYFMEGCNNYEQVKIDPSRGEEYFCSEIEAEKAGYKRSKYCM